MIRMKKNLFTTGALVAALAMAATSCSNEELATANGGKVDKKGGITEITADTPQEAPGTRLTYEHLSAGGLKVEWEAQSSSNTEEFYAASFLNGSTSYYKLIQSDNAPKASSSSFKVMQYNNSWSDGAIGSNEEIHALYPVKAAYEGVFQNNASTALSAPNLALDGQTGKLTDMKNFDYMTVVTTATATLSLQFKHRIAVLCLKGLTFDGLSGNEAISSFSISGTGLKPSAKLTITQGATTDAIAFTGIVDAAIATSGSTFAITSGTQSENAYICFFPNAEMNGKEMTVSATVGSDTYTCKFTVPAAGFLEGNMYTLNGKAMTKGSASGTSLFDNTIAAGNGEAYEGTGDESSPYLIKNAAQLRKLQKEAQEANDFAGKFIRLETDINLTADNWAPIGNVVNFAGTFDGNGHKITGAISGSDQNGYTGFFSTGNGCTIKNLTIEADVTNTSSTGYTGGIIAYNYGGENKIINCTVRGNVTGVNKNLKATGGIVGNNYSGEIINCHFYGTMSGYSNCTGGITGRNSGTVYNCCTSTDTAGFNMVGTYSSTKPPIACPGESDSHKHN